MPGITGGYVAGRSTAYENQPLDINKHRSSGFVIGSSQSISSSKDKVERCAQNVAVKNYSWVSAL